MKRSFPILLLLIFPASFIGAQDSLQQSRLLPDGHSHALSIAGSIPLGEFGETHGIGAGIRYEHSNGRFGRIEKMPSSRFGFIFGGGIGWHDGKKENTGNLVYTYHYDDFLYGYLFGGLNYLPGLHGNISLTAGPAMSSYSNNRRFNLYGSISGSYYPSQKFGLGAGMTFLKEGGAAWMAMSDLRFTYLFQQ